MKKFILFFAIIYSISLSSCTVIRPYEVTNNTIGTKTGESSTIALFTFGENIYAGYSSTGITFNKNYGIVEAAKNGKITKIGAIDLKTQNFILFKKYTLVVAGE